jgi:hypothetical protein
MLADEVSVPGKEPGIERVVVVALVDGADSFVDCPSNVRLGRSRIVAPTG